ncbi:Fe(3+) ions import ATP-binding protein FbpC 2 [Vibrio aerogenes CECT 7868]|uniref:Fe(3+) ions import ATP-binding protein FbpC 2 n=1 Tax=Vibrio aerogenes CECT 7868 TaxID=1216006 RepID=A0A1M5ZT93_9VIBR|nr:ABC transporter ATP-binding protein [Vibrio aerogenes]SHI27434.1 Fe(3+) ions import ATP-binding protein FbpC 2 [Vibrio aerogenes CECT 7868]
MENTLSISQLTCRYGEQTILESLSLSVRKGEIICLLGASGCGKTTLLKAIAGLLPLHAGKLCLNGRILDDGSRQVAPEKRHIGMIFQDYALFPHLTVAENVAFGLSSLSHHRLSRHEKQRRTEEMLSLVRLDGYQHRYPHQLSGGQQQRVAIARSLACQPELLLLDEPFSNIDTQVRHELIREIRSLFKQQGVTAIFVTHSREEAFAFADKMAVMNRGVIEQFGPASELYHHPSSRFVADFLGGGSYLSAKKISPRHFHTVLGDIQIDSPDTVPAQSDSPDQTYELLLRPQHVMLQADAHSEIQVLEQQFMGDHCRYIIDVEGNRLVAVSGEPLAVGDRVAVRVMSKGIHVFIPAH